LGGRKIPDSASRAQLRDKLNDYFKIIFDGDAKIMPVANMDAFLNQVD